MSEPKVSVVLPLFNGEEFVAETIESVLNQTLSDLELIIVNDGSTDLSEEIVLTFKDPRIVYFRFDRNRGMAEARNKGIELAKAELIAMTDQDDISEPARLREQCRYLKNNPAIELVGSWARHFGRDNWSYKYYLLGEKIRIRMLGSSQFCHPSVTFRRSLAERFSPLYKQFFAPADDFEMLCRVCARCQVANLPLELLRYRTHQHQESGLRANELSEKADLIRINYLRAIFGIDLTNSEQQLHLEAISTKKLESTTRFHAHIEWFKQLIERAPRTIDPKFLEEYFAERLVNTITYNTELFGFRSLFMPFSIPFSRTSRSQEVIRVAKSMLRFSR